MSKYETLDDGVEVNGRTVLANVDGIPDTFEEQAFEILAENGIEDPDPEGWYSQQAWLDSLEQIEDEVGESTVKNIGKSIPENAEWPPGVTTVVGGLESIDEAYRANHRGGEIGHYAAERVDDGTIEVRCDNPYPCTFDQGLIESAAKTFTDSGIPLVTETGDECRDEGGDECVYEVTW